MARHYQYSMKPSKPRPVLVKLIDVMAQVLPFTCTKQIKNNSFYLKMCTCMDTCTFDSICSWSIIVHHGVP